jgi:transglutaminase-like putative cysteine protease
LKARTAAANVRTSALDFLLVGLAGCFAVFGTGYSLNEPAIAWIAIGLIVTGTLFSFGVRTLLGRSKMLGLDGFLYAALAIACVWMAPTLNSLWPGEGFPRELIMAGVLTWMIILGSFAAWRDGTLLFQAVPSIALFGLLGCYDLYRNVTFAFFGFLICLVMLFARVRQREMLRQAAASGYFGSEMREEHLQEEAVAATVYDRIRNGPWRSLAGPEWALGSALVVILISIIGAPMLQESVKGISGMVRVSVPQSVDPRFRPSTPLLAQGSAQSAPIGRGSLSFRQEPLFEAKLDQVRYLRTRAFAFYGGRGWHDSVPSSPVLQGDLSGHNAPLAISDPQEIDFEIRSLKSTVQVPVPGEVVWLATGREYTRVNAVYDGTFELGMFGDLRLKGRSFDATAVAPDASAPLELPLVARYRGVENVPPRVREWAQGVAAGASSDFERATRIKRSIETLAKYNINAPAVPEGADAVEFFLFGSGEGYCDLFASAMVVGARSVDIPARYAVGFVPDARRLDPAGRYIVLDEDAHAWAELYFEGYGWVRFDPTEGAQILDDGSDKAAPWYEGALFRRSVDGGLLLLGVAGLVVLARHRRASRGPGHERRDLERVCAQFVAILERASGRRRRFSETTTEFLVAVRPLLSAGHEEAAAVESRLTRMMFAAGLPSEDAVAQLRRDVRNLKASLRRAKVRRSPADAPMATPGS